MRMRTLLSVSLALSLCVGLRADEKAGAKTVEQLTEATKKSLAIITFAGRDSKRQGLGTGFVVGADGLIATNLHVIGEGRPITVELADGKRYPVVAVHAFDRPADLALIRIDAKNLTPLELGDSDALKQGQAVVAFGNPRGLTYSVVAGVLSGRRDIEGRALLQVAIPVEPGNSGGPILDMRGRVQGILSIKALLTPNLGFAVPINALKPLIRKPNPVPMAHWLALGTLDPREWKPMLGAQWRQRGGRLSADGYGDGFGGRSFCLHQAPTPALPFEIAVSVRLDQESGAAGLIFHADDGDKHYGFYPSNGQLRLTRFEGPDVYSWKILRQEPSPHYRLGEWNTLKVRLEKDRILCYVNDHLVAEEADAVFTQGKVGLAKFRETRAEFKGFQIAQRITGAAVSAEAATRIRKAAGQAALQDVAKPEIVDALAREGDKAGQVLRQQAKELEQQAARLRDLAQATHQKRIHDELQKTLAEPEDKIDLLRAALLLAKLDHEELDISVYLKETERMAQEIAARLPKQADEPAKLRALNKYLFEEQGFHGSRGDYYNRANSYLNEVIDDREGIPITLSVLYVELARRLDLNVVGVALPGHFIVRFTPKAGDAQLLDVFEGAKVLTREDAAKKVRDISERPLAPEHLAAASKKAIVLRMLQNLLGNARRERDLPGMSRYLDAILSISPDAGEERWARALVRYQAGNRAGAREDTQWLLQHEPAGVAIDNVRELDQMLARPNPQRRER